MLAKLATRLRAMELFYQAAHNLSKGVVFNQDHSTFASFYDACGAAYDAAIERAINKEGHQAAHLPTQLKEIFQLLKDKPCCDVKENKEFFSAGLEMEQSLCSLIEEICKNPETSQGTLQLVGDMADKSEVRQYLISQRLNLSSKPAAMKSDLE